jgi:hypothetical protein
VGLVVGMRFIGSGNGSDDAAMFESDERHWLFVDRSQWIAMGRPIRIKVTVVADEYDKKPR